METQFSPLLVTEKTAAKLIGVSEAMLIAARFRKKPILPFMRVGTRTIRYRVADIHAYVDGIEPAKAASPGQRKADATR